MPASFSNESPDAKGLSDLRTTSYTPTTRLDSMSSCARAGGFGVDGGSPDTTFKIPPFTSSGWRQAAHSVLCSLPAATSMTALHLGHSTRTDTTAAIIHLRHRTHAFGAQGPSKAA